MIRVTLAEDAWMAILLVVESSVEDIEDEHLCGLLEHAAGKIREAVGA